MSALMEFPACCGDPNKFGIPETTHNYMNRCFVIVIILFSVASCMSAETINEDEMFSNPDIFTQTPAIAESTPAAEEKKTIGFSGEVTNVLASIIYSTSTSNSLYSYTVANIFLDVRMKSGIKAFANLETTYLSQSKTTEVALRELFFDFNFRRKVYLRTGKQVLQWGRCYLWNPTDLINIEKKTFIRKIGYREGAYGTKLHIPFGTKYNIYGFIDTGNVPSVEDTGAALKFEFLTGRTEMAFSGWAKSSYYPVFGYDISSRIGDVDIAGELSVAQKDNTRYVRLEEGMLKIIHKNEEWVPRASIDFSKGFRLGNFNDRFTLTSEFYYNHLGYDEDLFNDTSIYQFNSPLIKTDSSGTTVVQTSGTKKDYLLGNGLYEMHGYSRYYGAIFASITRFIITDMTLNVNYVRNLCDGSGIVSTGASYKNMNDFFCGLLLNSYFGAENREYTYSKEKYNAQLTAGIAF